MHSVCASAKHGKTCCISSVALYVPLGNTKTVKLGGLVASYCGDCRMPRLTHKLRRSRRVEVLARLIAVFLYVVCALRQRLRVAVHLLYSAEVGFGKREQVLIYRKLISFLNQIS